MDQRKLPGEHSTVNNEWPRTLHFNQDLILLCMLHTVGKPYTYNGRIYDHDFSLSTGSVVACSLLALAVVQYRKPNKFANIPTVGPDGYLTSYWGAVMYFFRARELIQEGYSKYKGRPFKIPSLTGWHVVLSGYQHIEEIKRVSDNHLSPFRFIDDVFGIDTVTLTAKQMTYFTQTLQTHFTEIDDEITTSLGRVIQANDEEWTGVPVLKSMNYIVTRTLNRVFVGPSLCRNTEWLDINEKFDIDVLKRAVTVYMCPSFLRPYLPDLAVSRKGMEFLKPIVEERRREKDKCGDDAAGEKDDMLWWTLNYFKGEENSLRDIAISLMAMNFGAVRNTTIIMTHALLHLATNPQYVEDLRQEVEKITGEYGWSKHSVAKMHKIDSFMKETLRFESIVFVSMFRQVLKDFTLSDGVTIPAGNAISTASFPTHRDNGIYEDADIFKPFRFISEHIEDDNTRNQMINTHPNYLPFGHGKHACPGRFFIATMTKAILAHIVITYDVKLEQEGVRPANIYTGIMSSPDPTARVLFRKRSTR